VTWTRCAASSRVHLYLCSLAGRPWSKVFADIRLRRIFATASAELDFVARKTGSEPATLTLARSWI
jgi:hypothetical protein